MPNTRKDSMPCFKSYTTTVSSDQFEDMEMASYLILKAACTALHRCGGSLLEKLPRAAEVRDADQAIEEDDA